MTTDPQPARNDAQEVPAVTAPAMPAPTSGQRALHAAQAAGFVITAHVPTTDGAYWHGMTHADGRSLDLHTAQGSGRFLRAQGRSRTRWSTTHLAARSLPALGRLLATHPSTTTAQEAPAMSETPDATAQASERAAAHVAEVTGEPIETVRDLMQAAQVSTDDQRASARAIVAAEAPEVAPLVDAVLAATPAAPPVRHERDRLMLGEYVADPRITGTYPHYRLGGGLAVWVVNGTGNATTRPLFAVGTDGTHGTTEKITNSWTRCVDALRDALGDPQTATQAAAEAPAPTPVQGKRRRLIATEGDGKNAVFRNAHAYNARVTVYAAPLGERERAEQNHPGVRLVVAPDGAWRVESLPSGLFGPAHLVASGVIADAIDPTVWQYNDHTNDSGDWCPWSGKQIKPGVDPHDEAAACPARCRRSEVEAAEVQGD